jgi:hypothetical protein
MPQLSTRTVAKFSAQFYVSQRPWRREGGGRRPTSVFFSGVALAQARKPAVFVLHFVLVSVTESYMKHVPRANFLSLFLSGKARYQSLTLLKAEVW